MKSAFYEVAQLFGFIEVDVRFAQIGGKYAVGRFPLIQVDFYAEAVL